MRTTHSTRSTDGASDLAMADLAYLVSCLESSLEYISIHRKTEITSPSLRPEEVVLTAPDGSLGASERTAE